MLCLFEYNLTKVITTGLQDLFSESAGGKLRLQVLVLVVDAGQALAVKHAVVTAVVDPGAVLHTLKHRGSLRYQDIEHLLDLKQ